MMTLKVTNTFRCHPMDLIVETDPDREEIETFVRETIKVLADATNKKKGTSRQQKRYK